MRKLFFFRSSSSNNGNNNYVPPPSAFDNEVYWDMPSENGVSGQVSQKIDKRSQSPKDFVSRPKKPHPEGQNGGSISGLRRSCSLSSAAFRCSVLGERNSFSSGELSGSPSNSGIDVQPQFSEYPARSLSLTPEKQSKYRRAEGVVTQRTSRAEKLDSPCSSRDCHDSSGNTSHSTAPFPLRCGSAHLAHVSNKILDLYIDGEQHEDRKNLKPKNSSLKTSSSNENCKGSRPPRVQSTTIASPTDGSKGKPRSNSFREVKDTCLHFSTRDLMRNELTHENPQELAKNVVERLSQVFPQKSRTESWDFDPEPPATAEDAFEEYLDSHLASNLDEVMQKTCLSDIITGNMNLSHGKDASCVQKESHFLGDFPESMYLAQMDEDDVELQRKAKEAKEKVILLSEEHEQESIVRDCGFSVSELLETVKNLSEERKCLALDVLAQLYHRITERASTKEELRVAKAELDSQIQRLEKEKNELQLGLEKELDRRSSDWSFKLGKYQSEEQRLRDRVRELAEQNVSLQREVSSLKGREVESRSKQTQLEQQLEDMTERFQVAKKESQDLQQTVSELQEQYREADAEMDCMRRSYKDKEKENKELQKTVVRLQRTCSEQDKTISGLRQGLSEELGRTDPSENHDNHVYKLQMEQMRLTSVEQILRREVESYRLELESLRHENINLLGRLQSSGNDGGSSFYKLDQELQARVDNLQNQGLSLFGESNQLCVKLLEFIKQIKNQVFENISGIDKVHEVGRKNGLDGYFLLESNVKVQNLSKGFENLTRNLRTVTSVLHEKSKPVSEFQSPCTADGGLKKLMGQALEENFSLRLKEEMLLTDLLREKLLTKQLELEQLQAELATMVTGQEILRCEVQGALDALSCVSHKMKDVELQMLRKDESIKQLRSDLQECTKELRITKDILPKVSEERDLMWEEVKQYSETNMLLNSEVNLLKKKIEALDEDILLKDGQITILKDSLGNEPFDILYSPKSTQELGE